MTMLDFNDLLEKNNIDPNDVIVLRHSPPEPKVRRILPWLAADRPEIFNAYQQTQVEKLERAMLGAAYLASFIGSASGTAVFVGLYKIGESRPLTREEYWQVPAYIELKKSGMRGFTAEVFAKRKSVLWFDLILTEFCCAWKGKLILSWPGQERSWWRRAHRNEFLIESILQDSALVSGVPSWEDIDLDWSRILLLPSRWKNELSHWRAIYLIFDCSDGKAMLVLPMERTICWVDGLNMVFQVMAGIFICARATLIISGLQYFSVYHLTWSLMTSLKSRTVGKRGCIPSTPLGLTQTSANIM